jgi:hypothetical protein
VTLAEVRAVNGRAKTEHSENYDNALKNTGNFVSVWHASKCRLLHAMRS